MDPLGSWHATDLDARPTSMHRVSRQSICRGRGHSNSPGALSGSRGALYVVSGSSIPYGFRMVEKWEGI